MGPVAKDTLSCTRVGHGTSGGPSVRRPVGWRSPGQPENAVITWVLSVTFDVLMLARPGAGAVAVVWVIAWYAILFGLTMVMLGFRLKGLAATLPRTA